MATRPPFEEAFRLWYQGHALRLGLDQNPDNPLHFYDWRNAYMSGARPDSTGHWPSSFKRLGHPNLIINGIDTRTGLRASPELTKQNQAANAKYRYSQ